MGFRFHVVPAHGFLLGVGGSARTLDDHLERDQVDDAEVGDVEDHERLRDDRDQLDHAGVVCAKTIFPNLLVAFARLPAKVRV